jgi:hypothetical protein
LIQPLLSLSFLSLNHQQTSFFVFSLQQTSSTKLLQTQLTMSKSKITEQEHILLLFSCIKNCKGAGQIDWNGVASDTNITANAA